MVHSASLRGLSRWPQRQQDGESRSLARRALHLDASLVFLYDAPGDREAETGALTDRLGREKGLEQPGQVLGGDAAARVGDRDEDFFTLAPGTDRDVALALDGMAGVDQHVQEYLTQLLGQAPDLGRIAVVPVHRAVVFQLVPNDVESGIQSAVQVGPLPVVFLYVREAFEVPHDRANALQSVLRLGDQLLDVAT